MAGLGRKVWSADEVLAAADLQNYIQDQTVMVYNDATARSTSILSPTEGMVTYLKSDDTHYFYNGSAWVGINAGKIRGITIFNSSTTPTANATGDLWFY